MNSIGGYLPHVSAEEKRSVVSGLDLLIKVELEKLLGLLVLHYEINLLLIIKQ